jgi:hypothetical protein
MLSAHTPGRVVPPCVRALARASDEQPVRRPRHARAPDQLRKICLLTSRRMRFNFHHPRDGYAQTLAPPHNQRRFEFHSEVLGRPGLLSIPC